MAPQLGRSTRFLASSEEDNLARGQGVQYRWTSTTLIHDPGRAGAQMPHCVEVVAGGSPDAFIIDLNGKLACRGQ